MKKREFVTMVRKIVSEEIAKQLPSVLSEMYIQKVVSTGSSTRKKESLEDRFNEAIENIDSEIPRDYTNDHEGIYHEGPIHRKNEVTSKLLSKSNPLAHIYENVNVQQDSVKKVSRVPLPTSGNVKDYSKILKALDSNSRREIITEGTVNAEMRRIEEERHRLDSIPVNESNNRKPQAID